MELINHGIINHQLTTEVLVEVHLKKGCISEEVHSCVESHMKDLQNFVIKPGMKIPYSSNPTLRKVANQIKIDDMLSSEFFLKEGDHILWQIRMYELFPSIHQGISSGELFDIRKLPSDDYEGLWESLHFDANLKVELFHYALSVIIFSIARVNKNVVSSNRLILLHGPPGTGKTSICKALAQKLSIRLKKIFDSTNLIEINAQHVFSKWFSESGKHVAQLFSRIFEMAEDPTCMNFVIIDEVESLALQRTNTVKGNEPHDSMRVVNTLLTQLDLLTQYNNVIVLSTSNITEIIDLAFLDRVDFMRCVKLPSINVRYNILKSCFEELNLKELVNLVQVSNILSELSNIADIADGLSGRYLRKTPLLAFSSILSQKASKGQYVVTVSASEYIEALRNLVREKL